MLNITITKTIRVDLTAEDWGLYTTAMDCLFVARELNYTLAGSLNGGMGRQETEAGMGEMMRRCARFGADDTEPREVLAQVLDAWFGSDTGR